MSSVAYLLFCYFLFSSYLNGQYSSYNAKLEVRRAKRRKNRKTSSSFIKPIPNTIEGVSYAQQSMNHASTEICQPNKYFEPISNLFVMEYINRNSTENAENADEGDAEQCSQQILNNAYNLSKCSEFLSVHIMYE